MSRSQHDLRCFCSRAPLLAVYGVDDDGLYVHVKVYKQRRIYAEVLVTRGDISLRCRECGRWQHVVILDNKAELREAPVPASLYGNVNPA